MAETTAGELYKVPVADPKSFTKVKVQDSIAGADGLVPVSSLGGEYWMHDDRAHALVGERTGQRWRLGREVTVALQEATPITGGQIDRIIAGMILIGALYIIVDRLLVQPIENLTVARWGVLRK